LSVDYYGNGDADLSCYVRKEFKESDPAQYFTQSQGQCMQKADKDVKPDEA